MENLIIFGILSLPIIAISRRTLFNPRSHGFYRFFSWECIIWLLVSDYKFWFDDPFSLNQILSWILLFVSIYLVVAGVIRLKKAGRQDVGRDEKTLFPFEKTSAMVDTGIFKYIRHPLYSSLIFLTWGIFLKNINGQLFLVAMGSTVFLYATAVFDEKECIQFFGNQYREYMKRSKRFIPFLI